MAPVLLSSENTNQARSNSPEEAIVFDDVEMTFADKTALDKVSFSLPRGETKAIFGATGSGKSTILKLTLGLLKPDAGRILVMGEDVTTMKEDDLFELRRRIGIVFQESALFDSLTVRDNVAYRLVEEGEISDEEIDRRVQEALSFVEMDHTTNMLPSELSGGMRRRVGIARAIITKPEVLLYDSPTGGLDPVTSTTIIELLVKQRDVFGTSSLLVTHRLQDAFIMATHYFDRDTGHMQPLPPGSKANVPMSFLVLRENKVIFDGDAHQLAKSEDPYTRRFLA